MINAESQIGQISAMQRSEGLMYTGRSNGQAIIDVRFGETQAVQSRSTAKLPSPAGQSPWNSPLLVPALGSVREAVLLELVHAMSFVLLVRLLFES